MALRYMSKYKYYFRQSRSVIAKDILIWLVVAGALTVAMSSPYFATNFLRAYRRQKKFPEKKILSTFYRLKREGLLEIEKQNHQIYISLTDEGRKKAGWLQINDLKILKPKKWDYIWRIVIFDIAHESRVKREAFRGFLIRLGFYKLQKSVWICPYDCLSEIELLRDFFDFSLQELRLIEAASIGNDLAIKKIFNI